MLKHITAFMIGVHFGLVSPHGALSQDLSVEDMAKLYQILERLKDESQRLEKLGSYQETLTGAVLADPIIVRDRSFPTELCEGIEYACAVLPITTQNFLEATK